MKEKPIFGFHTRKTQPKIRMVSNGSVSVNDARSQYSSSVASSSSHQQTSASVQEPHTLATASNAQKRGKLDSPTHAVEASVFIHFTHSSAFDEQRREIHQCSKQVHVDCDQENIVTSRVPLSEIASLVDNPKIAYIEMGEALKYPLALNEGTSTVPSNSDRNFGADGGSDVLMGIIDVGGFDFAHTDFLDSNGQTRFHSIWDQGGSIHPAPLNSNEQSFGYGSEIKQSHMDNAMAHAGSEGLPAQRLEPQSQMEEGSHATHVASIAAGNRGICRRAAIVGVLVDIPASESDRRQSFYDSTRIVHAIDYIRTKAKEIEAARGKVVPVSINISLGTNGNAHDGSSSMARWIDSLLTEQGYSVCVAAGNSGQESASNEEDFGYIMGRIHTSGHIESRGLESHIGWQVVGNTVTDVSENEFELWYSPADRFALSLKPPGEDWLPLVEPGAFIENQQIGNGSFISIYNEFYHPINGANYISVYLSPFLSDTAIVGVKPGLWEIKIVGREVRDGHYHAWIERDDPFQFQPIGNITPWRFPSFFTESSNVDNSSISSLACAQNIIAVANYSTNTNTINKTSSQGPTRDGRNKPEIAAPGTGIVAAEGFNFVNPNGWVAKSGTSMASPFVAGIAGLMLGNNPNLTSSQIRGILQRTADPLPGSNFAWKNDAGYGRINPEASIDEVNSVYVREDIT